VKETRNDLQEKLVANSGEGAVRQPVVGGKDDEIQLLAKLDIGDKPSTCEFVNLGRRSIRHKCIRS
jgi:hypothetical protein